MLDLLPIVANTYIYTFVFDPRVERYKKKNVLLFVYQYYIWIIQYNGDAI
jgi:hypothetical protein